jgi:hypothetical protein
MWGQNKSNLLARPYPFYATGWIRGGFQKSMTRSECGVQKVALSVSVCLGLETTFFDLI